MKDLKEKIVGATGTVSGAASILGSWQVCHSVCLGIIALLGMIGITVVGMPLLFLTKVAVPLWTAAVILLALAFWMYYTRKCISRNLLLVNSGLLIAGIPFQALQRFSLYFWIFGGALAAAGIFLLIKRRIIK
ncbi:MAG TPA: hypothetical protein VJB08_06740 [Candidatus Nanoarchaeia archaeon]|nr:hypothetical protein [Candidatus Nanoarchaeia archaeon]